MVKKIDHIYKFAVNAEHFCRHDKVPRIGEKDDGSFTKYNDIFETTSSKNIIFGDRMSSIDDGFQRYVGDYLYDKKAKNGKPGCDGSGYNGRGKHYRMKRVGRKIRKAIKKINRRKLAED